jgi:RHH-type rel operon transcriptional repressor/antitoxin RelB
MLGVRLDEELEARLERLSQQTGRSKSYYARAAILEYLEDREDYELAVAAARDATPHISLEELIRKYGLEDQLRPQSGKAVRQAGTGRAVANRGVSEPAGRRTVGPAKARKSA